MKTVSPDAASVERFRDDLDMLLRADSVGPVALAVSGGGDSMAMLLLANAARPGRVIAATVDHGLRAEGAHEAAMVAGVCTAMGVPHDSLRPAAPIVGASLQAQAREARYALLLDWARRGGAAALLTAHHADDQAETFLMRAARGSGLAGLSGIRPCQVRDGMAIVRPLLGWRRAELRAIVEMAGIPFVDDPSNADDRHDRTRFRRLLDDNPWFDAGQLARAARHLGEIDADLRALIGWLEVDRARPSGVAEVAIDVADLPRELRRRLARDAIHRVRAAAKIVAPDWAESHGIEPLLAALEAGRPATQAGVLATPTGTIWRFRAAPPHRQRRSVFPT